MKKFKNLLIVALMLVMSLCLGLAIACKADENEGGNPPPPSGYVPTIDEIDEGALLAGVTSLAAEPTNLTLNLSVNNTPVSGTAYLDLAGLEVDDMDIRAKLGSVNLWIDGGAAYVSVGDWKLTMGINELVSFVTGIIGGDSASAEAGAATAKVMAAIAAEGSATEEEEGILDQLLAQLAEGTISDLNTTDQTFKGAYNLSLTLGKVTITATLSAVLTYDYDDEMEMLLYGIKSLSADLTVNGIPLTVSLAKTANVNLNALATAEKSSYVGLATYANTIYNIVDANVIHGDISYENAKSKISVEGTVNVNKANTKDVFVEANIKFTMSDKYAEFVIAYKGGKIYLDLKDAITVDQGADADPQYVKQDIKLMADVNEAVDLIKHYLNDRLTNPSYTAPETPPATETETESTIARIIRIILSFDTTNINISSVTPDPAGETALSLAVKTSAILKLFDINLGIQDVTALVDDSSVRASVYGVDITVTKGDDAFASLTRTDADYATGVNQLIKAFGDSLTHQNPPENFGEDEANPKKYIFNNTFYLDGQLNANLLGLVNLTVEIKGAKITVGADKKVEANIKLYVPQSDMLGLVAINGNTTTDITIKDDMVYMQRVQTSKRVTSKWQDCDPITTYRVTPLKNFTGDLLNNLSFILNFGDLIKDRLPSGGSSSGGEGGGETGPVEPVEPTQTPIITSYTYTAPAPAEEGVDQNLTQSWELGINAGFFTDLLTQPIKLKINGDEKGLISGIELSDIKLEITSGVNLTATATVNWQNPQQVMKDGVTDQTADVSTLEVFASSESGVKAMIDSLNATKDENGKWTSQTAIEAAQLAVSYKLKKLDNSTVAINGTGETPATQQVYVSTGGDGMPANTLYTPLVYPTLPDDTAELYHEWHEVALGEVIGSDNTVYAQEYKQQYEVKFVSDVEVKGWDQEEDKWVKTYTLEYGASITVKGINVDNVTATVDETLATSLTYELPVSTAFGNNVGWTVQPSLSAIVFTGVYPTASSVTYHSTIAYNMENFAHAEGENYVEQFTETYTLKTPTAEGYTFIGWYEHTGDTWTPVTEITIDGEKVEKTVEALWAQTNVSAFTVTITQAERFNESGFLTKKYDYRVAASMTGDYKDGLTFFGVSELVEWANTTYLVDANVKTTWLFSSCDKEDAYNNKSDLQTNADGTFTTQSSCEVQGKARRDKATVIVTVVYTINGVTVNANLDPVLDMDGWTTL